MMTNRGLKGRGLAKRANGRVRPSLEALDQRLLLTVYTVTSNLDSGTGTLRDAITQSNADTKQANEIDFDILPAGQTVIQPLAASGAFPTITQSVLINGSTQPTVDPTATGPAIEIDGSKLGGAPAELTVATNAVTIEGLDFTNLGGAAINLSSGGSDVVQGCYIGIGPTGTTVGNNTGQNGILVNSASNTIGGTTSATRNVISGLSNGIEMSTAATTNTISGNYIGTNAAGTSALPGTTPGFGIDINGPSNVIGGFGSGAGNLISGWGTGININNAGSNTVVGNFIGTDSTGNSGIGNSIDGIFIGGTPGSTNNQIGGAQITGGVAGPVVGNVISDNGRYGIGVNSGSTGTKIQGNNIGIGANNAARLGNGFNGIYLNNVVGTIIGSLGSLPGEGSNTETPFANVIAYNGAKSPLNAPSAGILVNAGSSTGILTNSIYNNAGIGIQLRQESLPTSAPVITSALSGGSQTRIAGTIFEQPLTTYRIQIFSSTTSAAGNGQTFVGDYDVTTDSAGNASISTTLGSAVGVGLYLSATATQNASNFPNTSQFSSPIQVGQAIVSDLAITQTPQAGNPLVGQPYSYTLTVVNNGQDDATGVTITDTLPTNSTLVNTSVGTVTNGVLTIPVGDLAKNATATFTVTVTPSQPTNAFVNSVSVQGDNIDPSPTNNTATDTETVLTDADLTVVLTPTTNPTAIGTPLTFVLTVTNQGPSTANNVQVVVTLPSDYTNISAEPDQGGFSVSGNVLTITTGILPSSGSSTITLMATPSVAGTESTTATVSNPGLNGGAALADPNTANNTTTVPVTAANAADLQLSIAAAPDPVLSSQTLVYTISVYNNGPSGATNPIVTDTLPAGLTYLPDQSSDSSGGTLTFANGVVTATLAALAAGDTDTITIAVTPAGSGEVSNTASVSDTNEIDSDTTNNSATTATAINPADLVVTLNNPSDPLLIGTQYMYSVVVTNNGPADATNVTLKDALGGSAAFAPNAAGTVSGATLTENIGSLASGASMTVLIPFIPGASGPLLDTASVSADQFDSDENTNSATVSNLVNPVDLNVSVSSSASSVMVGSQGTFVITVINNGTTPAPNVLFNQAFPANASYISSTSSQGSVAFSGSTISGNLGTLMPGQAVTVMVVLSPTSVATITDTATVTSDGYELNPADNTGSASINATDQPGSFSFDSALQIVPENAGVVNLAISRSGGTLGAVTLTYSTSDASAIAGVNYVATTGTITFAAGQTTGTISIPIIDDLMVDGATGFFVTITGTTGLGSVGAQSVTAVLVSNTDIDTIPPAVTSFTAVTVGNSINGFVITFDKEMDPTRASLLSNYHIILSNSDFNGKADREIALAGAFYNPINDTVLLVPTASLPANRFYRVVVNGSFGQALTDLSGNVLYGSSGPNSNYDVVYGRGTALRYVDSHQNAVSINISGGGSLEIFRGSTGDAATVTILGAVPGKSKLTGSVSKLTRKASGHTTIGALIGLGSFGQVKSNLTTPGFYVIDAPLTSTISAASVPVTISSGTPKGPSVR